MDFDAIKSLDRKYHMPAYNRFNVAIVSGKGSIAVDVAGREYVDFSSGIGVNCLGYADAGWADAISKQASTLQHISNLYYSPVQVQLAEKLCEKSGFSKVFFCNSGAEANECAIKMARKYSFDNYNSERNEIITLVNSFHGRTVTTLAATGQDEFHKYFFPFTEGFSYVNAQDISALKQAIKDKTCAVMMELIQGEGGVLPLDVNYVKEVAAVCKEAGLLLIFDEVQTGVGRTGRLYAWEHYNVKPDIITSAKGLGGGLPFGACMCDDKLADVLSFGTHGTTYGGNPVACAGSSYVLDRVANEEFLETVREKGEYMRNRLLDMNRVSAVRGMGLMIGADIEGNAREIVSECIENGLLILTAKTALRMLPPLNITYKEIDRGLDILNKVLSGEKV